MSTTRVVILDAQRQEARYSLTDADWRPHIPEGSLALPPLRLSDFGAPDVIRTGAGARPVDWAGLEAAMARLSEASRRLDPNTGVPEHTLIVGQAPLPVFSLAGYEFGAWTPNVVLINRRRDGTWDRLALRAPAPLVEPLPFEVMTPVSREACDARGIVAVALSTLHRVDHELVAAYCSSLGVGLAALIELRAGEHEVVLDATTAPGALTQIREVFERVHRRFPRRDSVALFVSGPASLAFMALHAVNLNVLGPLHLPNYDAGRRAYEHAFTLLPGVPLRPREDVPPTTPAKTLPSSADGVTLLFVSGHERPHDALAPGREALLVNEALTTGVPSRAFKMVSRGGADAATLQQALNDVQPTVLHFSGHGANANSFAGIFLCGQQQEPRPVAGGTLVPLFQSLPRRMRLVVLNGCATAAAAQVLTGVVDAAIGWHGVIDEPEACTLAAGLYQGLSAGRTLRQAFEQARFRLRADLPCTRAVPELFVGSGGDVGSLVFARG